MTTLFLVRHGETDSVGRSLSGRLPGIGLNAVGIAQAEAAALQLQTIPLAAIYPSPLERTRETAAILAAPHHQLNAITRPAWLEIDFGDWTGRTFDSLRSDPLWHAFNHQRNTFRIPGGESFQEVRARLLEDLPELARLHPGQSIAIVSHADVIRTALCIVHNFELERMFSFSVETGSIHPVTYGTGR